MAPEKQGDEDAAWRQATAAESLELGEVAHVALNLVFPLVHRRARLVRNLHSTPRVVARRLELVEALRDLLLCALSAIPPGEPQRSCLRAETTASSHAVSLSIRVERAPRGPSLDPYDRPDRAARIASEHGGLVRVVRECARAMRFEIELPVEPKLTSEVSEARPEGS